LFSDDDGCVSVCFGIGHYVAQPFHDKTGLNPTLTLTLTLAPSLTLTLHSDSNGTFGLDRFRILGSFVMMTPR